MTNLDSPTTMFDKTAPQECRTRVPQKTVPQQCLLYKSARKSFHKSAPQEYPSRLPHKSECPTKLFATSVSHKSVLQASRVPHKSVSPGCPTRVPYKRVPQGCPKRERERESARERERVCVCVCHCVCVPDKSVQQECSVPQKCPTRVAYKSVLQGCPARASSPQHRHTRVAHESFPQE